MSPNNNPNIFLDLATLLSAGISILEAAKRVAGSYPNNSNWNTVIQSIENGSRFSVALRKSGIVNRFENEVISIAEEAGRIEQGLKFLSASQEKRLSRTRKFKSKLYYPFAILTVAIVVSAVLAIANNPNGSNVWLATRALIQFGTAFYFTKFLLQLLNRDACYWLTKLHRFENKHWYKIQFQQLLFEAMHWHVSSGIDPKTSFSRISKLVDSHSLRKKLLRTANFCDKGVSVSNAMRQSQLPITTEMIQLFSSGEHSGQLENTLKKQLELNQFEAEMKIENLIEWAPRAYYGLVAVVAAIAII